MRTVSGFEFQVSSKDRNRRQQAEGRSRRQKRVAEGRTATHKSLD
jgi:hypothetical protein